MTTTTLDEKPYAGNPHVRFDEGEVASEKPRRGVLFRKSAEFTLVLHIAAISVATLVALGVQAETYRMVEYLESTGAQSVDTGVMPTASDVIVVDVLSSVKNMTVIGAQSASANRTQIYQSNDASPKIGWRACSSGAATALSFPQDEQRRLVLDLPAAKAWVGRSSSAVTVGTTVPKVNYWLFAENVNGRRTSPMTGRIYLCRIDNAEKRHTLCPCVMVDGETETPGFYDAAEKTFLPGTTSGAALTAGPERSDIRINAEGELEYKVTIGCNGGGSVSPSGVLWVAHGGSASATATAESGVFKGWVDSRSATTLTTDTTLELTNITEPQTVGALFATGLHITNGPAVGDYTASFAAALELAQPGEVITLDEGTYPISQSIELPAGVSVKGAGMDKTVVTATTTGYRGFYLKDKDNEVSDLTAKGFKAKSGRYYYGAGFRVDAGRVKNCRATGNSGADYYDHGVGFYLTGANSSATNCVSDHNVNSTSTSGTGFYLTSNAKIWNCLAYDNTVCGQGAMSAAIHVVNSGTVYSSTVVGTINDGGIYLDNGGVATNCVSAGNSNYGAHLLGSDAPDIGISKTSLQSSVRCCVTGRRVEFRDAANGDYRLRPALAALTNAGYSPYDPTEDALDFVADDTHAFVDEEITLTAVQTGKYEGLDLSWKVEDASGATYPVAGSNPATVALPAQGRYTVTLTAAGEAPCVRTDYLYVRNPTNELAVTGVADELPAAVDAMIDGETLILGEGTYPTTRPVYMTNNVMIVGKGWDKTTVSKTGSRGVFIMAAEGAHLTGCTVTGGKASDYYNITGSGVRITGRGGKLSWCRMTGNLHGAYYTDGLGVGMESVNAWVTHCLIDNNPGSTTADNGGGVNMKNGLLENCLIVNNTARHGAGIYVASGNGLIRHCTIAKNTAGTNGGGICGYRPYGNYVFTDCVIAENTADSDTGAGGVGKPNWSTTEANFTFNASSFVNCAIGSPSAVLGDTSFNVNAPFVDLENNDFHLDKSGDAVEGGVWYEDMADVDLDGFNRVSGDRTDCGCYEVDMSVTDCSFDVSPTVGFTGAPLVCTPTVINPPAGVTLGYRWTFRNGNGVETVFTGESPSVAIAQGGVYTVKLEVYDIEKPETVLATNTRGNLVRLACQKVFAVGGGVNPTMAEPFDTWEKAHTNLNELETYLIGGCEVELGEGEFLVTNHLVLAQDIQYHGKGIDKTVVRCSNCRAFYLNNEKALVENLTVTNGSCRPFVAGTGYNEPGLGICIASSGGTVRNCRVTGSKHSSMYQRGAIACTGSKGCVSRCIIDNNTAMSGGDSYAGLYLSHGCADNCLVYSNKSTSAGGLAVVGVDDVCVSNCTFTANTATTTSSGGLRYIFGSYSPSHDIVNCIFAGNTGCARETTPTGIGQYDINELDFIWSGGYHWGDNQVAADKIKGVLKNCCFQLTDPEATLGTNCLNADPKFADAENLDFHLVAHPREERSPAINAGLYNPQMQDATDLDGRCRTKHVRMSGKGLVDIGCYESAYWSSGLRLIVR